MNGIHDMGGMEGFGPVLIEKNEPVFHAPWEGRIYALFIALSGLRKWNLDSARYVLELVAPADYLNMTYYQRWYVVIVELLVKAGMVTRAEVEMGHPAPANVEAAPPRTAEKVAPLVRNDRDVVTVPKFHAGQQVRTRNINPPTHTRLPRYARGKTGTVEKDYGVFVFPDTNSLFLGEKPQHVYSVRFAARELWGDQAKPQDAVYVNMWDDYLEPA